MNDREGRRMKHEEIAERLDDYVDGGLSGGPRREVEAHLESCESCRARVEGLRALLDAAADLPRSIEPPRDLWRAIDARMEDRSPGRARVGWRDRLLSSRPALAAAAVLLIAIASTVTVRVARDAGFGPGSSGGGVASGGPGGAALVAEWRTAERQYEDAASELQETLDAVGGELSPETRRIVEENLRVIDRAIAESRAALAAEPGNRELTRMLSSAYERKLEVLRHAARL